MGWTTTFIGAVLAVLFSNCEQTASEAIEMTRPPDIPTESLRSRPL